ncbi:hypothetical protein PR048_024721 [Dryococelus australis]|uniref:Reverse transcriptase Ty1/copia-type domain-containing protein n=1 Tax=Dryococelus australis TaxID=614101 RepID=A0ABQ9GPC9_9NEOP|nr:hypothetical protein PR048_024721 [Dryococelus australis]
MKQVLFFSQPKVSGKEGELEEGIHEGDNLAEDKQTSSGRNVKLPSRLQDYELYTAFAFSAEGMPQTYEEAMQDEGWREAINNELKVHRKMEAWQVGELPQGAVAIDSKWVFTLKDYGREKASLVACGFHKPVEAMEFVYAPVYRTPMEHLMLSFAVNNGWPLKQIDVPTAFLNVYLEKEVFLQDPSRNIFLVLHADDALITGEPRKVDELEKEFSVREIKNSTFLDMEISRSHGQIQVTQTKLIRKTLSQYNMQKFKSVATPMELGFQASKESPVNSKVPYRNLVCKLMYLAYTQNLGLTFKRGSSGLVGYCDADWHGDSMDRKSVCGFIALYNGNPIVWFSRKQSCVALSTMEAEYVAGVSSAQELSKTAKHIDIRYNFIKDLYTKGVLDVKYVPTSENIADIFTKSLCKDAFRYFRDIILNRLDLCFTAFGVAPLVFVHGSMNTEEYCNILDNEMVPTL